MDIAELIVTILPYAILIALVYVPSVALFKRLALSPAWALFALVPVFGSVIIVYVAAYRGRRGAARRGQVG